jgi:hypothetical protein
MNSKLETNALEVCAQSDKKSEIILSDGRFATIHHMKVIHLALSEHENEYIRASKLISFLVKIDEQPVTVLDAFGLSPKDFIAIAREIQK